MFLNVIPGASTLSILDARIGVHHEEQSVNGDLSKVSNQSGIHYRRGGNWFYSKSVKIINIIEEEDKRDFEESRPPGTTHKPLRHRHTNIILSFLAAYVQSDSRLWPEDKEIGISDLTGIAAAARAQIVVSV